MRSRRYALVAAGVVLLVGGGTFALLAPRSHQPPSLPVSAASVTPPVTPEASSAALALQRSVPVRVIIPAIGVNASVIPEGTDTSGALKTPPLTEQNVTGWWKDGNTPGQDGPAVIVGHIDSAASGPLVFWNLHKLVGGNAIEVELADGQQVWFTVVGSQTVSKNAFPTQEVYGSTPSPTLRLITCTGDFDPATGHYDSNLIVFAVLAQPSG